MTDARIRWETLHTVHDFYDGPLSGVASLNGQPHAYSRIFDRELDDWLDEYWLSPITNEQFDIVMDDWVRWKRWQAAFIVQSLGPDDLHPSLAVDRAQYDRDRPLVEEALRVRMTQAVRKLARFADGHEWKVQWLPTD